MLARPAVARAVEIEHARLKGGVVFAVGFGRAGVVAGVADVGEVRPLPASRRFETHFAPFLEVVHAGPGEEDDPCWRVGFILFEVEVQAQTDDADELEEVDVKVVWLRAIGLPEEIWGGMSKLWDRAAGFRGGYCPGC